MWKRIEVWDMQVCSGVRITCKRKRTIVRVGVAARMG